MPNGVGAAPGGLQGSHDQGVGDCAGRRGLGRWFAGQLAARRLCEYRVQRILFRARCAVHLGAPMGVRFARAYVHGELARLAARCGLEPNRPANHANIPR